MGSAVDLQALLRFLSQDAKVPLALAMGRVKELQKIDLGSPEAIAKSNAKTLAPIFADEKIAKQVLSAAKKASKKRSAGDAGLDASPKKSKKAAPVDTSTPAGLEASIALPELVTDEEELSKTVIFTNRAPLMLAFAVMVIKYTMPEQPLTARLSLAQAYVSISSRARAVNLGIEKGASAEDEGYGLGQRSVKVLGKDVRVMTRYGYDATIGSEEKASVEDGDGRDASQSTLKGDDEDKPALWGMDLEALRKSENSSADRSSHQKKDSHLPIHTPQSAKAYLLKSFDTAPDETEGTEALAAKKPSAASKSAEKEKNLGRLLGAIDLLYQSWAPHLSKEELDGRVWGWYIRVRPDVEDGVAGWGGKGPVKLANILDLRRGGG